MTEKHVQWLTYHFNIEYMFHVALDQLHQIDNNDEIYFVKKFLFRLNTWHFIFQDDDSILTDCSRFSNNIEEKKIKYLFNLMIYLWSLLIIWMIIHIWTSSFNFY